MFDICATSPVADGALEIDEEDVDLECRLCCLFLKLLDGFFFSLGDFLHWGRGLCLFRVFDIFINEGFIVYFLSLSL